VIRDRRRGIIPTFDPCPLLRFDSACVAPANVGALRGPPYRAVRCDRRAESKEEHRVCHAAARRNAMTRRRDHALRPVVVDDSGVDTR
jgi:hypothetical protein